MSDQESHRRARAWFTAPSWRVAIGLLMLIHVSQTLAVPPAPPACGVARSFERCEDGNARCERVTAYDVPDYWHGLAQCLRGLRDRWSRDGPDALVSVGVAGGANDVANVSTLVRRQVTLAMSARPVRFVAGGSTLAELHFGDVFDARGTPRRGFDRVVLLNDRGVAYNAMGQSGLSYFLLQMAILADRGGYPQAAADTALYRALARGAIATVLTPVSAGGLAASRPCDDDASLRCTWYHSITRRDQPTAAGATLNQHLHAVRDLALIANLLSKQTNWNDNGSYFNRAALEGLNQLIYSHGSVTTGAVPNLADFLSSPTNPNALRWSRYGFNPLEIDPARRAYFLGGGTRDCSYHLHNLDLLREIIPTHIKHHYEYKKLCGSGIISLFEAAQLTYPTDTRNSADNQNANTESISCPAPALWKGRTVTLQYFQKILKTCNNADQP